MRRRKITSVKLADPLRENEQAPTGTRTAATTPRTITHKRQRGPLGFTRWVKINPPPVDYSI
jgi:hypothetical protein